VEKDHKPNSGLFEYLLYRCGDKPQSSGSPYPKIRENTTSLGTKVIPLATISEVLSPVISSPDR
jgi:hypothetical protein